MSQALLRDAAHAGAPRVHGGTDALGTARFDFSSNSNACGPCPPALLAVQQADATRYPDPDYSALRERLAQFHGVPLERVLVAGSASEFIFRMSAWVARQGGQQVSVPQPAYGDYADAARAWGLQALLQTPQLSAPQAAIKPLVQADLHWCCNPSSPLGQVQALQHADPVPKATPSAAPGSGVWVQDCAYAPLLDPQTRARWQVPAHAWSLWSPNKALGLTGVRGAYAIAPAGAEADVQALAALAPSWVLGAHAVAMLSAWTDGATQAWLQASLPVLAQWTQELRAMLQQRGWELAPSNTHYFCTRPPKPLDTLLLRASGVKLRDTTSMGLPGWYRLSAQAPQAQAALHQALEAQGL